MTAPGTNNRPPARSRRAHARRFHAVALEELKAYADYRGLRIWNLYREHEQTLPRANKDLSSQLKTVSVSIAFATKIHLWSRPHLLSDLLMSYDSSDNKGELQINYRDRATQPLIKAPFDEYLSSRFASQFSITERVSYPLDVKHWNPNRDGSLTEEAFRRKIRLSGHDPQDTLKNLEENGFLPKTEVPTVYALLEGRVRLLLDDSNTILEPGDCVQIPANTIHHLQRIGSKPVRYYCARL
ncbi:hypothetical protein CMO92_00335 [Candidatus Woesearchaeota archaeon]|nr:hypothetical protein [Candidatus Woesearchaeota archaeon]|tara:strand:- start:264 stop:986 length:723 start_codon:yes stop_codon:yes gene_type:complete